MNGDQKASRSVIQYSLFHSFSDGSARAHISSDRGYRASLPRVSRLLILPSSLHPLVFERNARGSTIGGACASACTLSLSHTHSLTYSLSFSPTSRETLRVSLLSVRVKERRSKKYTSYAKSTLNIREITINPAPAGPSRRGLPDRSVAHPSTTFNVSESEEPVRTPRVDRARCTVLALA